MAKSGQFLNPKGGPMNKKKLLAFFVFILIATVLAGCISYKAYLPTDGKEFGDFQIVKRDSTVLLLVQTESGEIEVDVENLDVYYDVSEGQTEYIIFFSTTGYTEFHFRESKKPQ
ncbi:MAG: hypothetical protein AB1721_03120 [Patescibacteria group bacterium]